MFELSLTPKLLALSRVKTDHSNDSPLAKDAALGPLGSTISRNSNRLGFPARTTWWDQLALTSKVSVLVGLYETVLKTVAPLPVERAGSKRPSFPLEMETNWLVRAGSSDLNGLELQFTQTCYCRYVPGDDDVHSRTELRILCKHRGHHGRSTKERLEHFD
jgi:hypothetical protein